MAHKIILTLEDESVYAHATCDAEVGANCRSGCADQCGTWEDGQGCGCEQKDLGYCNVVEWLNSDDGPLYRYGGNGETVVVLDVETHWDADVETFVWTPQQPVATP